MKACTSSGQGRHCVGARNIMLHVNYSHHNALKPSSLRHIDNIKPSFGLRRRLPSLRAPATATAAAAAVVASPLMMNIAAVSSLVTSVSILIVAVAVAAFLLSAIPALWSLASVLHTVNKELPESAALLRLSGLELTECVSELSGLGSELTSGLRSTATMATMAEQSIRQGTDAITTSIVPFMARSEQTARAALEVELQQRAKLTHTKEVLRGIGQTATATTTALRRARLGMHAVSLLGVVVSSGRSLRSFLGSAAARNLNLVERE